LQLLALRFFEGLASCLARCGSSPLLSGFRSPFLVTFPSECCLAPMFFRFQEPPFSLTPGPRPSAYKTGPHPAPPSVTKSGPTPPHPLSPPPPVVVPFPFPSSVLGHGCFCVKSSAVLSLLSVVFFESPGPFLSCSPFLFLLHFEGRDQGFFHCITLCLVDLTPVLERCRTRPSHRL